MGLELPRGCFAGGHSTWAGMKAAEQVTRPPLSMWSLVLKGDSREQIFQGSQMEAVSCDPAWRLAQFSTKTYGQHIHKATQTKGGGNVTIS